MLPHADERSEEDTRISYEDFLRMRGGRVGPIWANHSHAERTANLQLHRANSRRRRRMQAVMGAPIGGPTAENKDANLAALLERPSSACDDPLATNTGQPPPCTYDCADLRNEYFPEPQSQNTRCFLFDPDTETWPEADGQGEELLSMR